MHNALAVAIAVPRPEWRSVAALTVDAVSSAHSKRAYEKALKDFLARYSAEARGIPTVVSNGEGRFRLKLPTAPDCSECLPQISLYEVASQRAFLTVALER